MVSNASEDFPDPLRPVTTVSELRGISTLMFFRLCWRAPRTVILVMAMRNSECLPRPRSQGHGPSARGHAHGKVRQWAGAKVLRILMVNTGTGQSEYSA